MKALERLFGKGKDRAVEDRTDITRRIWERMGTMAGNGKPTRFNVEKIDPQQLPSDLQNWDFLRSLQDPFEVLIENSIGRLITIIIETRYKGLSMRGPTSIPVYEEGIIESGRKSSFPTEPPKDPLDFADKFTMFVDHQREHARVSS